MCLSLTLNAGKRIDGGGVITRGNRSSLKTMIVAFLSLKVTTQRRRLSKPLLPWAKKSLSYLGALKQKESLNVTNKKHKTCRKRLVDMLTTAIRASRAKHATLFSLQRCLRVLFSDKLSVWVTSPSTRVC